MSIIHEDRKFHENQCLGKRKGPFSRKGHSTSLVIYSSIRLLTGLHMDILASQSVHTIHQHEYVASCPFFLRGSRLYWEETLKGKARESKFLMYIAGCSGPKCCEWRRDNRCTAREVGTLEVRNTKKDAEKNCFASLFAGM